MRKDGPVAILGDGAWGTALALVLHGKGVEVRVWSAFPDYAREVARTRHNVRYLPGVKVPRAIAWGSDLAEAVRGARVWVVAIPTQFIRRTLAPEALEGARAHLRRGVVVVTVAKGIEVGTGRRNSQVIREVLGRVPVCVLSGPSHAEEVSRGLPASVVAAAPTRALALRVQALFSTERLRVYDSTDVVGVELGGALKNIVALAAGIADGLRLGDNAKAALLTRGMAEMARLGAALGARRRTFSGLSGVGDLITTCGSAHSRNLTVGRAIGAGKTLRQVLKGMVMVAEGVETTRATRRLARRLRVEMPITEEVYRVLFEGKSPRAAVRDLFHRAPTRE
ncbi:MAG: NAD(P)-dependent glycerol-3-phosphate dehydrogenase [Planctomycetes bacterium]|nr:NAD(P)-dependent glycerol-3-phosphate dehydrogenase [Planctomycetota bacterium]